MKLSHEFEKPISNDFSSLNIKKSILIKLGERFFYWFCRTLFTFYCPITTIGKENLPSSPFILCSNHCSHIDSVVLMIAAKLPFSKFAMVAAKDYFFNSSKSRLFSLVLNLIPINRKITPKSLAENIQLCKNSLLTKKYNLIIYPEGTRSTTGEIRPFKRGPAMIATELNVPLVPVHIKGAYEAMPKGRFFPIPKRISVVIGEPLYPQEFKTKKDRETPINLYSLLTEKLASCILHLKEQHHAR